MIQITKEEAQQLKGLGLGSSIVKTMKQHSKSKRGKYYMSCEKRAVYGLMSILEDTYSPIGENLPRHLLEKRVVADLSVRGVDFG